VSHHRSPALGHLLAAEIRDKIRKSPIKVKKRNVSQEAVPLQREFHIRGGFAAASDPELFGKCEFSTSITTPQNLSRRSDGKIGRDRQGKV
jgi:hypothetical protein